MSQIPHLQAVIAEDDPSTRRLIGSLLTKWDFHVIECPDGETAWAEIEKLSGPLLAVVDWMMPGISGLDLCERIRALGKVRTGYIYTIMLTGKVERSDMMEALRRGVDSFLTKPLSIDELRMSTNTGRRILAAAIRQHDLTRELELKTEVLENLGRELDIKVQERTRELQESMQRAEAASKLKSEFLANMSHEIRTPLNSIVSYVDLLLDSELKDDQRSDLKVIRSSAHSLQQIINDILDLSKVEAGQMLIDLAPFRLSTLLSDVHDVVNVLAEDRGLTIVTSVEPFVPDELVGDSIRIQQVLMNLLSNAVKFCQPHGGVIVLVSGEYSTDGFTLRISVADSGIGIPEDRQTAVFEAFQQADGSTTRRYGGTGLGLTISRKLVQLMGGHIWLRSKLGVGTAFHFEVPCGCEDARAVRRPETSDNSLEALWNGMDRVSVLLADDHVINRTALVRLLESRGHQVITAATGQEVLDLLPSNTVDVILMDVQMPVMGGDEATTRIRESECPWRDVPIIALTANAFDTERQRLLQLGMNDFVAKPVGQRELATALAKVKNVSRTFGG